MNTISRKFSPISLIGIIALVVAVILMSLTFRSDSPTDVSFGPETTHGAGVWSLDTVPPALHGTLTANWHDCGVTYWQRANNASYYWSSPGGPGDPGSGTYKYLSAGASVWRYWPNGLDACVYGT